MGGEYFFAKYIDMHYSVFPASRNFTGDFAQILNTTGGFLISASRVNDFSCEMFTGMPLMLIIGDRKHMGKSAKSAEEI